MILLTAFGRRSVSGWEIDVDEFQIITFYEFKPMVKVGELSKIRDELRKAMTQTGVRGTIILADEGFNSSVCGRAEEVAAFVPLIEKALSSAIVYKSSFAENAPFRKIDVKIKPEIVTLRKELDVALGEGTHVKPADWNAVISDPEVYVLDTRNDYEFHTGTFQRAVNPETEKFSDLPDFVAQNLSPETHPRIAMFCTGGIRCEKFAPYMRSLGFKEVYQLEGGILKYLEEIRGDESLWNGECYVFDERVTVDHSLSKGSAQDRSNRHLKADNS